MILINNKKLDEILTKIKEEKKVGSIILFGSRAKGVFRSNSDYDIAVMIKDNDKKTTERILQFKTEKFDIIPYHKIPLYVKINVLKHGIILDTQDNNLLEKETYNTIKQIQDNHHHYSILAKYRGSI